MSTTLNPFDLLDADGGEVRRKAPKPATAQPKPAAAVAKPVAKPADAPKQATQPKPASAKNAAGAGAGTAAAGGKRENDAKARPQGDAQKPRSQGQGQGQGAGRDGGARRSPAQPRQQQQQGAPAAGNDGEIVERPRERRDRDHRSHGERPAGRGRQFDRRSGTGRPANENKRAGSGKANWGTLEEGQQIEIVKEAVEGEKEEAVVVAEGEVVPAEPPKSPEKELLSLDEYLAKKSKTPISGVEAPKLRAAGEGVDQSAWANYAALEKDGGEEAPQKKKSTAAKKDVNGKDDKLADMLSFTLPPHESADRGDRRGGRGGKGPGPFNKGNRGGSRQGGQQKPSGGRGKSGSASITLEDQTQFPSLGGSPAASPAPAAPATVKA